MNSRATPAERGKNLPKIPPPPSSLSPGAAREWRRIAPSLVVAGTLSESSRGLELLCETLATAADLERILRTEGATIASGSGATKAHPALRGLNDARALARVLLIDLGILKAKAAAPAPPAFAIRRWTGPSE